jgi:hypothetical protein
MVLVGTLCGADADVLAVGVSVALLIVVMVVARFDSILFALGALLPIYTIASISSDAFLGVRLLLIAAIVLTDVLASRLRLYRLPNWRWWLYGFGLFLTSAIHSSKSGGYLAIGFVGAAFLGGRIAADPLLYRRLFQGYRLGVFMSSLALLASVAGLVELSEVDQYVGHAGLSYRSTAFAYQAAISLVLWYWGPRKLGRKSARWLLEGGVVAGALLASGGRGGVIALVVAMVVLPLAAGQIRATGRFILVAAVGFGVLSLLGVSTLSIDRLFPKVHDSRIAIVDQYGSGRGDLFRIGLNLARQNPVTGLGFEAASLNAFDNSATISTGGGGYAAASGQRAHFLLMALLIAGGVGLATAALLLLVDAGAKAYRLALSEGHWRWVGAGIVIFLVNSLLEVGGGLLGVESALLFTCLVQIAQLSGPQAARLELANGSAEVNEGTVKPIIAQARIPLGK